MIGNLYFFNLVNVPLQKELDADTKKKFNPGLLSRALWYFRWGAVVTVLAGLTYYAMYILAVEAKGAGVGTWDNLGIWLLIVLITYAILYALYNVPALTKDGRILAVVIAIVVLIMSVVIVWLLGKRAARRCSGNSTYMDQIHRHRRRRRHGNHDLKRWGLSGRAERAIAAMQETGTAPRRRGTQAFLAYRTNSGFRCVLSDGQCTGTWVCSVSNRCS